MSATSTLPFSVSTAVPPGGPDLAGPNLTCPLNTPFNHTVPSTMDAANKVQMACWVHTMANQSETLSRCCGGGPVIIHYYEPVPSAMPYCITWCNYTRIPQSDEQTKEYRQAFQTCMADERRRLNLVTSDTDCYAIGALDAMNPFSERYKGGNKTGAGVSQSAAANGMTLFGMAMLALAIIRI